MRWTLVVEVPDSGDVAPSDVIERIEEEEGVTVVATHFEDLTATAEASDADMVCPVCGEPAGPCECSDLQLTQALKSGDKCEWRYPARAEWHPGTVVINGGGHYWTVRDDEGNTHRALYIEFVRYPGSNPWGDPEPVADRKAGA